MARRDRLVMSRPSNVTRPEVTGISPATQRASVDLPQPVSPTKPRVLPRGMTSDTSSTAWTWPTVRRIRPPVRTGKYLVTRSTRTSMSSSGMSVSAPAGPVSAGTALIRPLPRRHTDHAPPARRPPPPRHLGRRLAAALAHGLLRGVPPPPLSGRPPRPAASRPSVCTRPRRPAAAPAPRSGSGPSRSRIAGGTCSRTAG